MDPEPWTEDPPGGGRRGDARTAAPADASRPFVGRDREMAELRAALEEAAAGRGSLFLVGGEPGIGKSRLADELSAEARVRGALPLWGRCWEAGGAPPYWPWVQSLRTYVRSLEPAEVRAQVGAGAADLGRMLPELREILPDLPDPPAVEPETARFRLFDATATFLHNAAGRQPMLIVLDDLHAADAPSLLLLLFVAGDLAESRLLVLGTYRDVGVADDHPLAEALAELQRTRARLLTLAGLTPEDVSRFIELVGGTRPPDDLVAAVHQETEGNPLFIGEVVRLLAGEGRLAEAPPTRGPAEPWRLTLPEGIREVIGRRLARLSTECQEILTVAAVQGREFTVQALERATGIAPPRLLAAVDEAVSARVVTDVPGGLGRLRFAHALIRDALYEGLPPARRMALHRRVAEVLEELYAQDLDPHLAELAHHLLEAAPAGGAGQAVEYARRAGDRAAGLLAYEEAARLYQMALRALELEAAPDPAVRCDLFLRLGEARMKAGDARGSKEAFLKAVAIARAIGDPHGLGRAALGYGGRFVWLRAGSDRRLAPLLEEALAAVGDGDDPVRARLLARLACALRDEPSPARRDRLSAEAVAMARRLGDRPALAYALAGRYAAIWGPDNTEELLVIAEEILRLAEEAGEPERALEGHLVRHTALTILGDISGAKAALDAASDLAEELRQVLQRWYVACYRTILALFEGRFDEAEGRIETTLAMGARAHELDPHVAYRLQTFALRKEQGRVAEVEVLVRRSIDEYPWYPLFRCVLANLQAALGRADEAGRTFEALAEGRFAAVPRDNQWLFAMSLLPEVAAFLGDAGNARVLHELLCPHAHLNVLFAPEITTGAMARHAAVAAAAAREWEEAERHFRQAIEQNERMGARPALAHTRHEYARMLLARAESGDRNRAIPLLRQALEEAREMGMVRLAAQVEEAIRDQGLEEAAVDVAAAPSARAREPAVLRREGDVWRVVFEGAAFRVRDTKGLRYLAELLAHPGREVHALDLILAGTGGGTGPAGGELRASGPGDAGEILDPEARRAYRRRLEELREELEESEAWGDAERAARARSETEFLARELAGAVGLGGRGRRAASASERARQSVTKAVKLAILRLARHSPALGRHLTATVRTGTFCSYSPDPRVPIRWET